MKTFRREENKMPDISGRCVWFGYSFEEDVGTHKKCVYLKKFSAPHAIYHIIQCQFQVASWIKNTSYIHILDKKLVRITLPFHIVKAGKSCIIDIGVFIICLAMETNKNTLFVFSIRSVYTMSQWLIIAISRPLENTQHSTEYSQIDSEAAAIHPVDNKPERISNLQIQNAFILTSTSPPRYTKNWYPHSHRNYHRIILNLEKDIPVSRPFTEH